MSTLTSGSRLGPYELLGPLGAGGMGEVYRAKDLKLGREVAIKILPERFASDPDRLARFQREAQVLASLNHPNIAAIYGLEESEGTKALVLELVPGGTLADRIARGPIPLDEALPIAKQIAEALEAAHEQGIIHRDLKPANIKVTVDGVVKVLDFGLAKLAQHGGAGVAPTSPLSMSPTITSPAMVTGVGVLLGTAPYMSPEQAKGREADKRSDAWAFGCVLYEMLTGRRAFAGDDVAETIASVLKTEPDWSALPPLPPLLRFCVLQTLAKDRRQRLRDFADIRVALSSPLEGTTPAPAARPRWTLPLAAGVAAIVSAAVTLWFGTASAPEPPRAIRFQITAPAGGTIAPGTPAISPNGRSIAYVVESGRNGESLIHVRDLDSTVSRPLPGTEDAVNPFWSPDGRSLAFVTRTTRSLKRIDISGGGVRTLVPAVLGSWHGSWGRDGDILFLFTAPDGVARVSADGGPVTSVVQLNADAGEVGSSFPVFLEDGKRFLVRVEREATVDIHVGSLGSAGRKPILTGAASSVLLAPTPAGPTYLLFMRDESLIAQEFDQQAAELRGQPQIVIDAVGRVASPPVRPTVGISPAGVLAYQVGGDFAAVSSGWVSRTGQKIRDLPSDVAGLNAALSPDGQYLLLVTFTAGGRDFLISDLTRGFTTRLATSASARGRLTSSNSAWSPDGRQIALRRNNQISIIAADGSGQEQPLGRLDGRPLSWSGDGRLLFVSDQGLFMTDVKGGTPPIAVGSKNGTTFGGRFSPDSRYIAYASDETGKSEVYLQPSVPSAGHLPVSVGGGANPRWSKTGELFYIGEDRYVTAVTVAATGFVVSQPKRLFQMDTPFGNSNFDVSGDGQQFLVPRMVNNKADTPITVVVNWWAELLKKRPTGE